MTMAWQQRCTGHIFRNGPSHQKAANELEHSLEMQKVYRHMAPWLLNGPLNSGEQWKKLSENTWIGLDITNQNKIWRGFGVWTTWFCFNKRSLQDPMTRCSGCCANRKSYSRRCWFSNGTGSRLKLVKLEHLLSLLMNSPVQSFQAIFHFIIGVWPTSFFSRCLSWKTIWIARLGRPGPLCSSCCHRSSGSSCRLKLSNTSAAASMRTRPGSWGVVKTRFFFFFFFSIW